MPSHVESGAVPSTKLVNKSQVPPARTEIIALPCW